MNLILASKSPRRCELLTMLGYEFETIPTYIDEEAVHAESPAKLVEKLALVKARPVLTDYPQGCVIGSDTIVVHNGQIFGKPKNVEDAQKMLSTLSGQTHCVFTGLALVSAEKECTYVVETKVTFKTLSDFEIDAYVKTKEPMDKAGAYGIQGIGAFLVERIEGDYYTVMGLPLCILVEALQKEFGISLF